MKIIPWHSKCNLVLKSKYFLSIIVLCVYNWFNKLYIYIISARDNTNIKHYVLGDGISGFFLVSLFIIYFVQYEDTHSSLADTLLLILELLVLCFTYSENFFLSVMNYFLHPSTTKSCSLCTKWCKHTYRFVCLWYS